MSPDLPSTKTLITYICGDSGPLDDFNPFFVMRQRLVPELLYALNRHPLSLGEISSAMKIDRTEASKLLLDLTRIKAVNEESGVYSVTFSIFTSDDLLVLKHATSPIAVALSNSIVDRKSEINSWIENLSSFEQVERGKLLFAALGCFVLDWLGLKILQEEGILVRSKLRPGNRSYLLFAREQVDSSEFTKLYGKMYWGSNSDKIGDYVFTSFGDHTGLRYAFPDIVWTLRTTPRNEMPRWMSQKLSRLTELIAGQWLKNAGHLLLRLNSQGPVSARDLERDSEATGILDVLHLLDDMNYITRNRGICKLDYPVFAARDKKVIEQLGHLVLPLVAEAIHRNYAKLEKALKNTSPIRNKVELDEVLNEAWHWIFGQTNRVLAEKGFLYDPPRRRIGEARYIAWISEFGFP